MEPIVYDLASEAEDFRAEVRAGLRLPQRSIQPKYLYDAEGCELFDRICGTAEYYPTRTEIGILRQYGSEMAELIGRSSTLIEFGSGSGVKTPLLLERLDPDTAYVPIEICRNQLVDAATRLAVQHPRLRVFALCADYTRLEALPLSVHDHERRAIFFPGSTIGNYPPQEARNLLESAARLVGPAGTMLVGVDCKKKEPDTLNAAYNDASGYTEAFNLNLLGRMRRELGAEIEEGGFSHYAFYNPVPGRVEMHLYSRRDQLIRVADEEYRFNAGETIHTESSYKYRPDEFQALARSAGWRPEACWTDDQGLFSIHCIRPAE